MSVFDTWSKNREAKKQADWEARLADYQSANWFNKDASLISIPTPAWERYLQAEYRTWYEATGSEELYRFYATRFPPQYFYNTNSFYRVSRNSDIPALHYNLAQVITKTMANLVFAKEPEIDVETGNKKTDAKVQPMLNDAWTDNRKLEILRKAAEIESYSGAVGFKFIMDTDESQYPIIQLYPKEDMEIRRKYDRVFEICFKDYYPIDGDTNPFVLYSVYGRGYIRYEMYQETWDPASNKLGMNPMDLSKVPQCANLKNIEFLDSNGQPTKRMMAVYKENKECARSDYYGIIDDMVFLDELYSNMADFMRKSKIKTYLHDNSVIKDQDDVTGAPKTIIPNSYDTSNIVIPDSNPNWQESEIKRDVIMVKDGFEGYTSLFEKTLSKTLSTVGLSVNTVLMSHDAYGSEASGAALSIKERASMRTRNDKLNRWRETISQISNILFMLSNASSFSSGTQISINTDFKDDSFVVKFPEYEEIDVKDKVALVIQKLNAGLMTKEDAWLELYPDMDIQEIDRKIDEVDEEKAESQAMAIGNQKKPGFSAKDAMNSIKSNDKKAD